MEKSKIKILVIDDSAIVRDVLSSYIQSQDDMELLGTACDPYVARDKIVQLKPDVITLDIEMPRMDGLTFLDKLMHYWPIPVIIVSSITQKDNTTAIKAMELGAFDVVNKPSGSISVNEVKEAIVEKIRNAYYAKDQFLEKWKKFSEFYLSQREKRLKEKELTTLQNNLSIKKSYEFESYLNKVSTTDRIVAIGSSTGGTVALEFIFQKLPKMIPPILVVQHMPPTFTYQFAKRLDEICQPKVKEAEDGEIIQKGTIYIAPGGYHMGVTRSGGLLKISIFKGERVNFQIPAVDVLFKSIAEHSAKNTLAILLTGMGKDGAQGLLEIKKSGGYTIAQDEQSSIVWGMPKAAIEMGAASEILPLDKIDQSIIAFTPKEI